MAQNVNVEEIAIITRFFGLECPVRLIIQFYSLYHLQNHSNELVLYFPSLLVCLKQNTCTSQSGARCAPYSSFFPRHSVKMYTAVKDVTFSQHAEISAAHQPSSMASQIFFQYAAFLSYVLGKVPNNSFYLIPNYCHNMDVCKKVELKILKFGQMSSIFAKINNFEIFLKM